MTNNESAIETEYDRWFFHQVASTQERVASGQARLIPHDEFWREIDVYARELARSRAHTPT
jgi:hypothetical protein